MSLLNGLINDTGLDGGLMDAIHALHHADFLRVKHTFKVEYHANENPVENSEKIAYVGQRLMYPINKQKITPYHVILFLNSFESKIYC